MQAYLQQYSLYPPFLLDRRKRPCDLFIVCRFDSIVLFRKFLFRWGRISDSKFSIEVIALFYENNYGFEDEQMNEKSLKHEVEKILGQKRFHFRVSPIFFGVSTSRGQDLIMDLKLLGDEVCFQALRNKAKEQYFLMTSPHSIPLQGVIAQLIQLKRTGAFYTEEIHLPSVCFEFSEADISRVQQKWSKSNEGKNKFCPHLFFSTKAFINHFGKLPNLDSLNKIRKSGDSKLRNFLKIDPDFNY